MFKKLETAWNAQTPDYLHPRTKENVIWQLKLAVILVGGMIVYEEVKDRLERRKFNKKVALRSI